MADTINLDAAKKIISVQGLDHYHKKASAEISSDIISKVSNPNLLHNPNFAVNQRGASGAITDPGYFIDRWKLESGSVTVNADRSLTLKGTISQTLESDPGADTAVSCNSTAASCSYDSSTKTFRISAAASTTISWAKLEIGSVATPFSPPDPAVELPKCQRFFVRYGTAYGWFGTGFTSTTNRARLSQALPVPLRSGVTRPTVTVHGTLYINTPTKLGVDALALGDFIDNPILHNNNLCMGFVIPDGAGTVEPCYGQLRDADSYIDISAEL